MRISENSRKTLYLIIGLLLLSICSLTIVYAAMSAVLRISGNSEVVASSWNIYLDNVEVKSGSVSANAPKISGTSSVVFDVELNTPGEFYEFTVDVVNDGSIDAMIDSVVKTPITGTSYAKYIKYEVSYENGDSINTKQTLKKGTSTPIKVRVEYRKDLVASDLPNSATELSLKLTLIYVQSDGTGSEINNNGVSDLRIVSGDINTIGSEICVKDECFYVFKNDGTNVMMLSKYNLYVGGYYDTTLKQWIEYGEEATGLQDSNMRGASSLTTNRNGTVAFADINYWADSDLSSRNLYVYNVHSPIYNYVEKYKEYLIKSGMNVSNARLIKAYELYVLGCDEVAQNCSEAPDWVSTSTYWSGSAYSVDYIFTVTQGSKKFAVSTYSNNKGAGVRPVIEVPVSEF